MNHNTHNIMRNCSDNSNPNDSINHDKVFWFGISVDGFDNLDKESNNESNHLDYLSEIIESFDE